MKVETITATATIYENPDDLPSDDRDLLDYAIQHLEFSYAPYSDFRVAAAIRYADGSKAAATNQENASYPLGACAEHNILSIAGNHHPIRVVSKMAIAARPGKSPPEMVLTPCGGCRQVMREYERRQGSLIQILCAMESGKVRVFQSAGALLPWSFAGGVR